MAEQQPILLVRLMRRISIGEPEPPVGVLELPATTEEIDSIFQRLGIEGMYTAHIAHSIIPWLEYLSPHHSVHSLNQLASNIQLMDQASQGRFDQVLSTKTSIAFVEIQTLSEQLARSVAPESEKEKDMSYDRYCELTGAIADKENAAQDESLTAEERQAAHEAAAELREELRESGLEERYPSTSSTAGDYSPSSPWNAPGMSYSDFI